MTPPGQHGGDGAAGSQLKISLPPLRASKRKGRRTVFLIPAGLLATLLTSGIAWMRHDDGKPEERVEHQAPAQEERVEHQTSMPLEARVAVLEKEMGTLRTEVGELQAKEAERQRLKEINAAIEARLTELANKVGPGRVK